MSSASVTRRILSLDFSNRDSVTKWADKDYDTETTIKGSFDPAAVRMLSLAGASVPYTSIVHGLDYLRVLKRR